MRKILCFITSSILIASSLTNVVACVNPFNDPNSVRITIVTDGHTIDDNSFNNSAYQGALLFKSQVENFKKKENLPVSLRNKKIIINYEQPRTLELNNFIDAYSRAKLMTSEVTIASGFIQQEALIAAQNKNLKNLMRYIYIDGDTPNSEVSSNNKNLLGLLFKAEQSGFLAGIAAIIWLIANKEKFGENADLSLSTYGGLDIPAVTSYMLGFYWSIKLFNNINKYSSELKNTFLSWIKELGNNNESIKSIPNIKFISAGDQFTGNFNQASSSSTELNKTLTIQKKTKIIFPVAGPQTSDTIGAIKNAGYGAKIVGVDTDQEKQYTQSADLFLTSALKNIKESVSSALWNAFGYNFENHKELEADEEYKIFKTDASPRGDNNVGIVNSKAISKIYNNLIENKQVKEFKNIVSDAWVKILSQKTNYWENGTKLNPFEKNF